MSKELSAEQIKAIGRELESGRWTLPERYRLTPEMLAECDADQKRLAAAAVLPYGGMSPLDIERVRSVVLAENLRVTLDELEKQISRVIVTGEGGDLEELRTSRRALRHSLAERLAITGRYDLAAEIEPESAYRDRYVAILDAVLREDDEWCNCGELRGSGEHVNLTVSQQVVDEEIFSIRHGQIMMLLKCNSCGFLNVSSLPNHIANQRSLRARARQVAGSLSPAEAEQELSKRGHTSVRLLRS